jgi:4-cresol dehydrogenase (hydroxylating)
MVDAAPFTLPAAALARFREILPEDAVHVDDADRDQLRDPYWFQEDRSYDSSAVLYPTKVEEIQDIVRAANEFGVPVWTSSQGRNNGYGGPSPRVKGSVLISLRRMNKVLEINHELAYAVVEPGVRWMDLAEALEAEGGDLLLSVPDVGWGSIVGNSMDNGVSYLPNGADFMAPTGLEVVLPDGELLRTGLGSVPGNKAWHLYKRGLGPTLDAFFAQSNFGIVVRMGVWLMPKPEAMASLQLSIPRNDQLGQAIDIIRELRMSGAIRGVPGVYSFPVMAWQVPELGEYMGGKGALPEEELQELAERSGLGRWSVGVGVWGDGPVVEHHVNKIKERWAEIEGSSVGHEGRYTREQWGPFDNFRDKINGAHPTLDMLDLVPKGIGHLAFSPVIPLVGEDVQRFEQLISAYLLEHLNANLSAGMTIINDRSLIIVVNIDLVLDDQEQVENAYRIIRDMIEHFGKLGYSEYRAHIDIMDTASAQYSFNDHSYRRFIETIKDAVDPNGIISPGRHGIWPAQYRDGLPPGKR